MSKIVQQKNSAFGAGKRHALQGGKTHLANPFKSRKERHMHCSWDRGFITGWAVVNKDVIEAALKQKIAAEARKMLPTYATAAQDIVLGKEDAQFAKMNPEE